MSQITVMLPPQELAELVVAHLKQKHPSLDKDLDVDVGFDRRKGAVATFKTPEPDDGEDSSR